ncbi:GNAT family N-acetyltransferase [Paucibacter sp. XJ19-41]|uniref:GNAT family N-acetyltransferase n=1 Tax=Paucibacter sp. XJ19-41 TaxID=2927824 RepID=UPI00234BF2DA|nr:GNAT family N-acetyltransferase [Paucibacter sp. XJ19-41]MDC6169815.1 GNAT family N-acetyltransferase [Paucibacter sp. XJ19-41]
MPQLSIRAADHRDAALIHRFICELAAYEKAEHQVEADVEDIAGTLFAPDSPARAVIGHVDGRPAGLAVYFFSYSTWQGRRGLYLEDLYVSPAQRGSGLGRALLAHLAGIADQSGCGRFEWSVLDWNSPAIRFYEDLGAAPQREWVRYRLSGAAIAQLAGLRAEGPSSGLAASAGDS